MFIIGCQQAPDAGPTFTCDAKRSQRHVASYQRGGYMKTLYVELSTSGAMFHFASNRPAGMVITVPDDVWVTSMPVMPEMVPPPARRSPVLESTAGFPPRALTEAAIVQIIR